MYNFYIHGELSGHTADCTDRSCSGCHPNTATEEQVKVHMLHAGGGFTAVDQDYDDPASEDLPNSECFIVTSTPGGGVFVKMQGGSLETAEGRATAIADGVCDLVDLVLCGRSKLTIDGLQVSKERLFHELYDALKTRDVKLTNSVHTIHICR